MILLGGKKKQKNNNPELVLIHLLSYLPYTCQLLLFFLLGHLCSSSVTQHGQDCLHFRPSCLHPELQTGRLQEHQVCGVSDAAGRQRLLQLHHAIPPAVLEHVHGSRYTHPFVDSHASTDSVSLSVLPTVAMKSVQSCDQESDEWMNEWLCAYL